MGTFDPVVFGREICRVELNLPVTILARTNDKVWHVSFLTIQPPSSGSVNAVFSLLMECIPSQGWGRKRYREKKKASQKHATEGHAPEPERG
jgi:hypothetical protein